MGRHKRVGVTGVWHFTPRERVVLIGICRGFSFARIAHEMGISFAGVVKHADNIRSKVGARDRFECAEIVQDAIVEGRQDHV
jgi:DNA-binding NarL/FixJ family response regulator